MNSLIIGAVIVASVSGAFVYGGQSALKAVKASCDNPDTVTVLEKQDYICMSEEDMKNTVRAVYMLGIQAGRKIKEL